MKTLRVGDIVECTRKDGCTEYGGCKGAIGIVERVYLESSSYRVRWISAKWKPNDFSMWTGQYLKVIGHAQGEIEVPDVENGVRKKGRRPCGGCAKARQSQGPPAAS